MNRAQCRAEMVVPAVGTAHRTAEMPGLFLVQALSRAKEHPCQLLESRLVLVEHDKALDVQNASAAGLSIDDLLAPTPATQFSVGKSFQGFAPIGAYVVTLDEIDDPESLRIQAQLSGEGIDGTLPLQDGNTRDLIFSVPTRIASLSAVPPLLPGDIIVTGTPAGVGMGHKPPKIPRARAGAHEHHRRHPITMQRHCLICTHTRRRIT